MTMLSPPGSGGSPERESFSPTVGGGQELKILHRRIFLSASNFVNSIGSYSIFDNLSMNGARSGILRRALEVTILDRDQVIPERPSQDQTYQERMERKKAEEAIASYIQTYSKDSNFTYGFRLVKEFIRGLRVYLDGSGGDARLNQNDMVRIGTTTIEIPATEMKRQIMNDSRGYALVEHAENSFLKDYQEGVERYDRTREGIKFAKTLFKIALVEETQKGEGSPTLNRLAIIHPE